MTQAPLIVKVPRVVKPVRHRYTCALGNNRQGQWEYSPVDAQTLVGILNYTANTAGLYLMLALPAFAIRLAWWYAAFTREKKRDGFAAAAEDTGAIAEREIEPRTLEYWHEPLCWWHIVMGLLCLRVAPIPGLVLVFGLGGRGALTMSEYLQVLFFGAAVAFFLMIWVKTVRAFQFHVDEEGIAFKPGMHGETRMRWEDIDEAVVYGARPLAAVVTGTADDGETRTALLYNGFYKRGDFETITHKLLGRAQPQEVAPSE